MVSQKTIYAWDKGRGPDDELRQEFLMRLMRQHRDPDFCGWLHRTLRQGSVFRIWGEIFMRAEEEELDQALVARHNNASRR